MGWAELSEEDQKLVREAFASGKDICRHCGGLHLRACPRVRRIVFRKADEVAEVEFWPASMIEWPEGIIWPEEVEPDDGSSEGVQPRRPAEAAGEAGQGVEAVAADDRGAVQGVPALLADAPGA